MAQKYFIIDFDSTFIQVEALDELAKIALAGQANSAELVAQIQQITDLGMNGELSLSSSLTQRLQLLNANQQHLQLLIDQLLQQVSTSFARNQQFISTYAEQIYIVSSGFHEYIQPVVTKYGVKSEHIFANRLILDDDGNILGLDSTNPLAHDGGKVSVVKNLALAGEVYVIGDGFTDYEIRQAGVADKFYAFVENVAREKVINHADMVIKNFDEFLFMHDLPRAISYPRNRIKILLLENLHPNGIELLHQEGYSVETLKGSLSEDELCEKIKDVSVLGIRSKTMVTRRVLQSAKRLTTIGAFCIGTNQIDLVAASERGICVFNAPYSNTRSVVEMVIGEIIMLLRRVVQKNNLLHQGIWDKSADNCYE
ncbi:MAG: hypothetical protein RLZZ293_1471, partial [Pseudomonadota bacterium]